jgi:hypothetical protein
MDFWSLPSIMAAANSREEEQEVAAGEVENYAIRALQLLDTAVKARESVAVEAVAKMGESETEVEPKPSIDPHSPLKGWLRRFLTALHPFNPFPLVLTASKPLRPGLSSSLALLCSSQHRLCAEVIRESEANNRNSLSRGIAVSPLPSIWNDRGSFNGSGRGSVRGSSIRDREMADSEMDFEKGSVRGRERGSGF